jgi:hypothetical protein
MSSSKKWFFALALLFSTTVGVLAREKNVTTRTGLCLPDAVDFNDERNEERLDEWPVCSIYLHGLFGGRAKSEVVWEVPFRKILTQVAVAKKCRIAVPFGDMGRSRHWNGVSVDQILARTREACRGNSFVRRPSIIGFSNGANVLIKHARKSCRRLESFSEITLIGANGNRSTKIRERCQTKIRVIPEHSVPEYDRLSEAVPFSPADSDSSDLPDPKRVKTSP